MRIGKKITFFFALVFLWNIALIGHAYAITSVNGCMPVPLNTAGETYVLANDVSSAGTCFNITADNITLDGQGHTISYASSIAEPAINIRYAKNVTVNNVSIEQASTIGYANGIGIYTATDNTIANSTIATKGANSNGISLEYASASNKILNNTITATGRVSYGIFFSASPYSSVTRNRINTTDGYAIYIYPYTQTSHYNQSIDATNTEQGMPIYYYFSNKSIIIENLYDVGELYVTNSTNVTIRNITVIDKDGIILAMTRSSSVYGSAVNISGAYISGIAITDASVQNNITGNNITTANSASSGIIISSSSAGYSVLNVLSDNRIVTKSDNSAGIWIYGIGSDSNKMTNNLIITESVSYSPGVDISFGSSNEFVGGSIMAKLSDSYSLRAAGIDNNFTDTDFMSARGIYFWDTASWFNYNNQTGGNIWLKTGSSVNKQINRTLASWSINRVAWNDTNMSAGMVMSYNITGLVPLRYYEVYNATGGLRTKSYALQADSAGNLPGFTIALGGNTEVSVSLLIPQIDRTLYETVHPQGNAWTVVRYGTYRGRLVRAAITYW